MHYFLCTILLRLVKYLSLNLLIILITGFSNQLFGQIQKGQIHIGGHFFFHEFIGSQADFDVDFNPEIGVCLSSKWSAGLGLPFNYTFGYENGLNDVRIAPFIRHYSKFKNNLHFIVQLQVGTQLWNTYQSEYFKEKTWEVHFEPIISYTLKSKFGFEFIFGNLHYVANRLYRPIEGKYTHHYFDAKVNTVPTVKFRYYFKHNSPNPLSKTINQ